MDSDAPPTLEGYYVLHDAHHLDWTRWKEIDAGDREIIADEASRWLMQASSMGVGDSAAYSLIGQKGDLLLVHYRDTPDQLAEAELSFKRLRLYDYLKPAFSYFSVIELSLNEAAAIAAKRLGDQGLTPQSPGWETAYEAEMAVQRQRLESRLRPVIPTARYCCFYPMSKRRGESVNWYDLPPDERRSLMRGHGRIGHKYHHQVTQVISGSIGLDDWEWGVTLYADDCLVFKKLITEMRFDPASSRYAEFGRFHIGLRVRPDDLRSALATFGANT